MPVCARNTPKHLFFQKHFVGTQEIHGCHNTDGVEPGFVFFGDTAEVCQLHFFVIAHEVVAIDFVEAVWFVPASCLFGEESIGADTDVDPHPVADFVFDTLFYFVADLFERPTV